MRFLGPMVDAPGPPWAAALEAVWGAEGAGAAGFAAVDLALPAVLAAAAADAAAEIVFDAEAGAVAGAVAPEGPLPPETGAGGGGAFAEVEVEVDVDMSPRVPPLSLESERTRGDGARPV